VDNWQEGKRAAKVGLQQELGLTQDPEVPLIGIVSRLAGQKGWDLIIPLLRDWIGSRPVQWAILGTGERRFEEELRAISQNNPQQLAVRLEFSEGLAHRIEAACDIFLMPSRYEPCGLNQLYSLRYGSVPVVHATGGLADTVVHTSEETLQAGTATGFQFHEYSLPALTGALSEALDFFQNYRPQWTQIVQTGMRNDWSWQTSAQRYKDVYLKTICNHKPLVET